MSVKSLGHNLYLFVYRTLSGFGLYKWKWVRKINKKILSLLRKTKVTVNGLVLHLDKKDSLNLSVFPSYEPVETAYVKAVVRPGFVAVDIGANIGYYTTLLAKLVGNSGMVYAFEPDKENYQVLRRNIEANGLTNVVAENLAVCDRTCEIKLFYSGDKGDQRTYDSNDGRKYIAIKATSLDDYFREKNTRIDFIKVDIQGSEGEALLGMRKALRDNPDVILNMEFWPFGLEKSGFGTKRIFDLLKELQLEYRDINRPEAEVPLPDQLIALYPPETKAFTNLICTNRRT